MRRFIIRRLAQNVLMLAFVIVAVFILMRHTSGDPARIKAPVFASPDILDRYRAEFGTNKPIYAQVCQFIDGELAGREFIATNDFTMADIILQTTVDFGLFLDLPIPDGCKNLKAWHERVSARPSAGANA